MPVILLTVKPIFCDLNCDDYTCLQVWLLTIDYSRWENGGQPQQGIPHSVQAKDYSRWENGGQPQQNARCLASVRIIADGRTGANRNSSSVDVIVAPIIADGTGTAVSVQRDCHVAALLATTDGWG